jgi:hypothetical protein
MPSIASGRKKSSIASGGQKLPCKQVKYAITNLSKSGKNSFFADVYI